MDEFGLERFINAQAAIYEQVLGELRTGRKTSHWMWFIFPQITGLGISSMARRYAISSRDEAVAYLEHPLLGARLRECTAIVNTIEGRTANQVFGSPDDVKFRSSMTLFAICSRESPVFQEALSKYYGGEHDPLTVAKLKMGNDGPDTIL